MTLPSTYPDHYASDVKALPIGRWRESLRELSAKNATTFILGDSPFDRCPRSLIRGLSHAEIATYIPYADRWITGQIDDDAFAAIKDRFAPRRRFALLYAEAILHNDGDFTTNADETDLLRATTHALMLDELETILRDRWAKTAA